MMRTKILSICVRYGEPSAQSFTQIHIGMDDPSFILSAKTSDTSYLYKLMIKANVGSFSFDTDTPPNQIREDINDEIRKLLSTEEYFSEYIIP